MVRPDGERKRHLLDPTQLLHARDCADDWLDAPWRTVPLPATDAARSHPCGPAHHYPSTMATRTRAPMNAEETRQVLRRAAELDREHRPSLPLDAADPRIDPAELERIAAESGLSPESLRRAIDELQGGGLSATRARPRFDASARQTFA